MSPKNDPYFKPFIEEVADSWYKVTAPRNIRQRIYDAIEALQDGVLRRVDDTTTIMVKVNNGYNSDTALHILVVATHIALTNNIEDLLRIRTHAEHVEEIRKNISFHSMQSLKFTDKDLAPWIHSYLCNQTISLLKSSIFGQFSTLDGGLQNYITQTNIMRSRVCVEVTGLMNIITRRNWLKKCDDALSYFEIEFEKLKEIATLIDEKYKEAQEVIKLYEKQITKTGPVGQISVYLAAEKSLTQLISDAGELRDEIDKEGIKSTYKSISTLLPPAKK